MHACIYADIQTYRRTDVQTYDVQTQTYRRTHIQTYRHKEIKIYRYTDIQIYRYTGVQIYRYTNRHADMQTYRHADIHTYMHTYIHFQDGANGSSPSYQRQNHVLAPAPLWAHFCALSTIAQTRMTVRIVCTANCRFQSSRR